MDEIRIRLLGRLRIRQGDHDLRGFQPRKVREVLCYLLLHQNRPQAREKVASMIYGEYCTTDRSRKYLRNALWRLQAALDRHPGLAKSKPLIAERDWVELRSDPMLIVDTNAIDRAHECCQGKDVASLNAEMVVQIDAGIAAYSGPLLEGWEQDWCVAERADFARKYRGLLEKRMAFCEHESDFERGIDVGYRVLKEDCAHEPTHQRLMRLFYLSGDRTRALRQFARCVKAMKEEFDAAPATDTVELHDLIVSDPRDGKQLARQAASRNRDPFKGQPQSGVT